MRENTVKFKQIQESDHGNYSCQINTDPVTIKTGYLEVKGSDFILDLINFFLFNFGVPLAELI